MLVLRSLLRMLFGRRLPITQGTLRVPGIADEVRIRRDRYGIPYIDASGDEDAYFALGFCQGQDRGFQIECLLRLVRGTLAELVGKQALAADRISRRIGIAHAAEEQLAAADEESRRLMESFARGVNEGIRTGCPLPHEFGLLRARPSTFRASDFLGILKLLSIITSTNWSTELIRLKILLEDGPEALSALDPPYPEWLPVTAPPGVAAGPAIHRLAEDMMALARSMGPSGGSNNWVLGSSRTATGRPILANDPHMSPALPPHWYLARLRTPNWAVAGACLVGTPGFPVGHNGVSAWGHTAGLVDDSDLFLEEIGPDGRSVRQEDTFIPCRIRSETIRVRGGRTVTEQVLVTPRGPVVGPALGTDVRAISLRATWLDPAPCRGLLRVHRARSFEEFRRNFEQWPALSLNMVYADVSGTIGWQLAGRVPKRRQGWGTLPYPGWDPQAGWESDTLSFEQMPYLCNPEVDYVATANTKPTLHDETPFLGADWAEGYRLARIVEALSARRDWNLAAVQALQTDQKSLPWQEVRDVLLSIPGDGDEIGQALGLLKGWDGFVTPESTAAALFELFLEEMITRLIESRAPRSAQQVLKLDVTALVPNNFHMRRFSHLVRLLREQPAGWFERPWPEEMADALRAVVKRLRRKYGQNPSSWTLGKVRPITLRHPMGTLQPLDRIFNRGPFPWGGDMTTVGPAPYAIASLRAVIDVGNWDNSRFVLPGGQSGNPLSPHYDDLLALWKRGQGVPIAWSSEEIDRVATSCLLLVPIDQPTAQE